MKSYILMLFVIGISSFASAQEKEKQPTSFVRINGANIVGREPLVFISQKETTKEISVEEFEKIDSRRVYSLHVLKGQQAIDRYGERARYGAIIVTMKGNSFSENYPGKKE